MKRILIAITLVLVILLPSMNIQAITSSLVGKAADELLTRSYTFTYNMSLPTGELVPAYQNRTITVFPNNTVETFVEIKIDEFPQYHLLAFLGQHLVQANATRRFQAQSGLLSKILFNFAPKGEYTLVSSEPHRESADLMQYMTESYATLGSSQESIRPLNTSRLPTEPWPNASNPPLPPEEYTRWDTIVMQLLQGWKHPLPEAHEDPFEIAYNQPDNYYNYPNETHKRDWGAEWAFVNTIFCSHVNKSRIDELEHGTVTEGFFLSQQLKYLGIAIGVAGGLIAGIPAILLGVGLIEKGAIVSIVCPMVGVAILLVGALIAIYAASKEAEYFSTQDWIDQALRTAKGDSFCYLKILTDLTHDVSWKFEYWGNGVIGAVTVGFTKWVRHYMECFGKELMQEKWTEIKAETGCFVSSVTRAIALPSLTDQYTWWPGPYLYP